MFGGEREHFLGKKKEERRRDKVFEKRMDLRNLRTKEQKKLCTGTAFQLLDPIRKKKKKKRSLIECIYSYIHNSLPRHSGN